MKVLKTYEKFLLKEDVEMPEVMDAPEVETPTSGTMTLYRLTSHPVVDLSAPGEFYVSKLEDVNPDLLENPGNELFLLTVECPADNVDTEKPLRIPSKGFSNGNQKGNFYIKISVKKDDVSREKVKSILKEVN
jgi:hypothetical protein